MLPSPASLARSKPWPIVDVVDLGILRRDQHDAVAEQIDARRLVDALLADRIVHPVEIGGDEDVGRRALLDLLGERRACGIARGDLDAGLGGEGGVDVVERVLHRSGGKHGEGLVLGRGGRKGRSPQDDEGGEKSGKTMHRGAPCVFALASLARANQALVQVRMRGVRKRRSVRSQELTAARDFAGRNHNRLAAPVKAAIWPTWPIPTAGSRSRWNCPWSRRPAARRGSPKARISWSCGCRRNRWRR